MRARSLSPQMSRKPTVRFLLTPGTGTYSSRWPDHYQQSRTFGVASPSCSWSRVASALSDSPSIFPARPPPRGTNSKQDDYHLVASGPDYRSALIVFFVFCATGGVPPSLLKTAGGGLLSWVGFELIHCSHKLGFSQRRAEWFAK